MQIITAATLKGGTGKTATLFNLAGILAENDNVLLIDCDPQTNLSLNCGVDITDGRLRTVIDIFENFADYDKFDRIDKSTNPKSAGSRKKSGASAFSQSEKTEGKSADDSANGVAGLIFKRPIDLLPRLDIIPSSILLASTELKLAGVAGRESILKYFLQDNAAALCNYKYVLIDTSPSMSVINQNAFFAADSIILVSDISLNGIQGAELFIELWRNARRGLRKEDNIRALVLNNFDRRIKLSAEMTEYAAENDSTGHILLNAVIPASVQVKNCEIEHMTINLLHAGSPVHEAYRAVAAELAERGII